MLARFGAGLTGIAFIAAVVLAARVFVGGAVSISLGPLTWVVDVLAVLLLMLVAGLSGVIQSFAIRYLRGDPRQGWFVVSAIVLTGCTAALVCAGSVFTFTLFWLAAGGALVALLATYSGAQARDGVRRTALRLAIADTVLVAVVIAVMVIVGGDVRFDRLGEVVAALPSTVTLVLAIAVIVPALARSSQVPFQGWLPATLATPTPVSALLHAGVVNAGAILLIRFSPVVGGQWIAMTLVFAAGAITLVYASAVRLVKPDVKGRLVFSTMGQMGFMIMACGVGAFGAAVFHLIAHSLFKATLFLGAGSVVRRHAQQRAWPAREPARVAVILASVVLAAVVPAAALGVARASLPAGDQVNIALLGFVAITGAVALGASLMTHFSAITVALGVAATVLLAFGYVAFLAVFDALLAPLYPAVAASPWLLLAPLIGLIAVEVLARRRTSPGALDRFMYARALSAAVAQPKGVNS